MILIVNEYRDMDCTWQTYRGLDITKSSSCLVIVISLNFTQSS